MLPMPHSYMNMSVYPWVMVLSKLDLVEEYLGVLSEQKLNVPWQKELESFLIRNTVLGRESALK